ncbi:nucleoside hydrolase [Chromatiales bacterium (ex Bugula neritina AB1)]|nr:nucleoside hydrolase [Chromatiales bacterium (ex Bugula neritina AB1)]
MARRILLDCDPGHDDAVAILLALASPAELELIGISVVGGNVKLDATVLNTRKLLSLAARDDIDVYAGCPRPMLREIVTAEHVHGDTGLDSGSGRELPDPLRPVADKHAVNFIIDSVRNAAAGEITLVATGPLTNIAVAFAMAPDIIERLQELVIMGGAGFEPGNVTPAAEFNIYVDPHAARAVFESSVKLTMFGLDITHQMLITPPRLKAIEEHGGRVGAVVADLLDFFNRYDIGKYGWDGAPLHDPCTIAWLIDPTLFEGRLMHVVVDTSEGPSLGRTVTDWFGAGEEEPNVMVMTSGDADRFFALITDRLSQLD